MNVVLLKDIKHLGQSGDIVEVAIGYARNFLFPQKIAVVATPNEEKRAEKVRSERVAHKQEIIKNTSVVAEGLKDTVIVFRKKVSSGNKLFGGIAEIDIADAIKEQAKVEIDKSQIHLTTGHIKAIGEYDVDIHLYEGKHVSIKVKVEAE